MYSHLTQDEREKWLEPGLATGRPAFKKAVTRQDRDALQRTVFNRMSYDEKLVGGGPEVAEQVRRAQQEVYDAVDQQVTAWGIEHNEQGWRADAYLYCNEVTCPECGWRVPLAPSWVIGEKTRCIAELYPDAANQQFDIRIVSGVSALRSINADGHAAR